MRALNIAKKTTYRHDDGLDAFLKDISKYDILSTIQEVALVKITKGKPLTTEEEDSLRDIVYGKVYRDIFVVKKREELGNTLNGNIGDISKGSKKKGGGIKITKQQAIDVLASCNIRFVVSVAKQYMKPGLNLMDLINEGCLGLVESIHKFDETRGFKFISYGVWWVRQKILQSLGQKSIIRIPANQRNLMRLIWRIENRFIQENGYLPVKEDILKHGITEDQYEKYLNISPQLGISSLDASFETDDDERTLGDIIPSETESPYTSVEINSTKDAIRSAIDKLMQSPQTYYQGLILSYVSGLNSQGKEYTTKEIADILNRSEGSIRVTLNNGRQKLAKMLGIDLPNNEKPEAIDGLDDYVVLEGRREELTSALEYLRNKKKNQTIPQCEILSWYGGLNPCGLNPDCRVYSIAEIAEKTGRDKTAVKQRLIYTIRKLSAILRIKPGEINNILTHLRNQYFEESGVNIIK